MKTSTYFDSETWLQDDEHSVALVVLRGFNKKIINYSSNTVYEVISGSGRFSIEGDNIEVSQGSRVTAAAGCAYQDQGDLVMLATSRPPYNQAAVEVIEETVAS